MIRLAYLQVGAPRHGICRYGRALAAEGRRRGDLLVTEENVQLDGEPRMDRRRLRDLARTLSSCADLVHVQVSLWGDGTWGSGWQALANLWTFRRHCRVPLVITLHDPDRLAGLECVSVFAAVRGAAREAVQGLLRPGVRFAKQVARGRLEPGRLFVELWDFTPLFPGAFARVIARAASLLLVITTWERDLLHRTGIARDTVLIPHFVEPLPESVPAAAAGAPPSTRTVIVAGFIFNSKGHRILIQAMPFMPDVRVVFVGGPVLGAAGSESDLRLMSFAREKGVEDRLEITGYLQDDEFRRRLTTADLAVCPFEELKSASGSLSSLIAAGCPVLASEVPLIAEYNALVPGAIPTFSPYTPEALAAAITRLLAVPRAELTRGLSRLRERLSIAAIYGQHLEAYRRVLGGRDAGAPRANDGRPS
jgi:glycosyltransferase involved in cell wall biosynthesis